MVSKFKANIVVSRKRGVADPEGNTIAEALVRLGNKSILSVRVSRMFQLTIDAKDIAQTKQIAERVATEVLTNPVIETFTILDMEEINK